MSMRRRFLTRASAAAPALTTVGPAPARAASSPVRGIFNWIHGTGNAERAFAFYHDVFGIELARSPFAGGAQAAAPPEPVRPAAHEQHGSRFRTVFIRVPNSRVSAKSKCRPVREARVARTPDRTVEC
jgi:hypothetical protein